jgi:uncharacterized protein YjeT (DUF2065 family)
MPYQVVLISLVILGSAALAYGKGGPPEKITAGVILGWAALDTVYHLIFGPSGFQRVDPVHVVLDSTELVAVMWLALTANRMWPLWVAAAQLMCVSGHIGAFVYPHGMRRAYWAMTQLPQYIMLTALLLGAAAHKRRLKRVGQYRSWRLA